MSVKQKMTALADEVRTLSGTTESKTVDDMTSDVGDANEVITSQALLISSIKSAIDNLPNAIPEDQYKDSTDLVVDGAKVITPAGFYPSDAEKSVKSAEAVFPTFEVIAEEETSEMWVRAINRQAEGYVPLSTRFSDVFVSLTVEGDTATMSCGDQAIVRKMEGGGGGVPTATVTINKTTSRGNVYLEEWTVFDGQSIWGKYTPNNQNVILPSGSKGTKNIDNVVIGSLFIIHGIGGVPSWDFDDSVEILSGSSTLPVLRIKANTTITFADID